jgi:hypothetical protein
MKKFSLQDVMQVGPLLRTILGQMFRDPANIPRLMTHVGPGPLADWIVHVSGLALFSALHSTVSPRLAKATPQMSPRDRYLANRARDAFEYGSGSDFRFLG